MEHGALVLEGGSLRALFTAGVLDVLMESRLWLEYVNGVSAGSLCAYNYIARQPDRTRTINETFCVDGRYLGFHNLVHNGGVFNFRFLFGEVADVLCPVDRETFRNSRQIFEAVATDCLTGRPVYFRKGTLSEADFDLACQASSSMPGLSSIIRIGGVPYLDGGCSCPVAYQRAMELGYGKIVVVLTRPLGFRKRPEISSAAKRMYHRLYGARYPTFVETMYRSQQQYNLCYAQLERLEREGRVFVFRPEGPVLVRRLERDSQKLEALYQQGRRVAEGRMGALIQYLHSA